MKPLRSQSMAEIRRRGSRWIETPTTQRNYRSTGFFPAAGPARDAAIAMITPRVASTDGQDFTHPGPGTDGLATDEPNVLRRIRTRYHLEFARTRVSATNGGLPQQPTVAISPPKPAADPAALARQR